MDDEKAIGTIAEFLRDATEGRETAVEVAKKIAPDGKDKKVTVALQRRVLQPEEPKAPARVESPRRAHRFADADGFTAYLSRYGAADHTVILADVAGETISAVLNEQAKDGFEMVCYSPSIHPTMRPWVEMAGCVSSIESFVEFVAENRRVVVVPERTDLLMTLSHIRASTKIVMHKGRGAACLNGVLVETEIQGKSQTDPVDLPDKIVINAPMFADDTEGRDVEFDLLLSTSSAGVTAKLYAGHLDAERTKAFQDAVGQIKGALPGAIVGLGNVIHDEWKYIR